MGIKIYLNGREEEVAQGITVAELLDGRRIRPEVVTVELNGRVLGREEFGDTFLKDGDEVELVYYMGGGFGPLKSLFIWR